MGKYNFTKMKNNFNTSNTQRFYQKTKHFSHKQLRFSYSIHSISGSWANRLFQSQKPYWRRKITPNFSAVTSDRIIAELLPDHIRSTAGQRAHTTTGAHGYSPHKQKDLGVPFSFNTLRYFWYGKLLLLPKKTLYLFLSHPNFSNFEL